MPWLCSGHLDKPRQVVKGSKFGKYECWFKRSGQSPGRNFVLGSPYHMKRRKAVLAGRKRRCLLIRAGGVVQQQWFGRGDDLSRRTGVS